MTPLGPALLIVVLTLCDASVDSSCGDCNENEPWRPLFKPSQIIHSEFPEHAQYRSREDVQYHSHEQAQPSREQLDREHEHLPQYSSEAEGPRIVSLGLHEAAGIDSHIKTYSSKGRHRVEWDHYGDVSHVTTVAYNSIEDRTGVQGSSEDERPQSPPNSEEQTPDRLEHHSSLEAPERDTSMRNQEGNFFNDGHFFDENKKGRDDFPMDFEISKENIFPDDKSNSIEFSHENFGRFKTPVATSYSRMSSVFAGARPVLPEGRDLLHPDLPYNDVSRYLKNQELQPVSQSKFFNGKNVSQQYLVHEKAEEAGVLRINPADPPAKPPGTRPYIPLNHPVYRYVKNHGELFHKYRQPVGRSSSRQWQDVHPHVRSKFTLRHVKPYVRVLNHETVVRHVMPTKDPFSDSFWKASEKVEKLKPPPYGRTLFFFKKKPNMIDLKRIARRSGPNNYMYIIKTNKMLR